MSITRALTKAFESKTRRGWDHLYFCFDIHETILYPDYNNADPLVFYPYAKEVLQFLSTRDNITISLYTCSHPKDIDRYLEFFKENGISFKFANQNPDVQNTHLGCYEHKPYFNVLFEDKAGFDPENDWILVKKFFDL